MLRKFTSLIALLGLVAVVSPSLAAKPNFTPEIPEVSGLYEVPGHPGLRVRVFVHNTKPGKPGQTSNLVCNLADPAGSAEVTLRVEQAHQAVLVALTLQIADPPAAPIASEGFVK